MNFGSFRYRRRGGIQQGYVMLLLMLMAALVIIGLAVEIPTITSQIRHDREEELIHRGAQYARAIKKFYKKTGAYPVNLDQLKDTNHIRFLRKKYKDPMTGEDFRLLHLGEVQLSLKPAGSTTGPGVGPGSGTPGAFGGAANTFGNTASPFSSGPGTSASGGFGTGQGISPDSNSAQTSGTSATGAPGGTSGSTSTPSGGSSSPLSSVGGKNPKFGGGPIIGVASTSEKQSFHEFNEKDHYNDWEFIYDPTQDRGGLIKGPYNGTPSWGGGKIPGAVAPGQMQQPNQQSPFNNQPSSFNQGSTNQNQPR